MKKTDMLVIMTSIFERKWSVMRQDGAFEKTQDITFSLCDFTGRLKPSALLRLTSDLAGEDYVDRGLPHDRLMEEGYVFLVSRARFNIIRNVQAEEQVKLTTYEREKSGPFCIRDYIIENSSGELLIAGRSAWIICEPVTRRIVRPDRFPHRIELHQDRVLPVGEPDKLRLPEGMELLGERRVVYSDLDGNGHVNNSVYGDMACDVLPMELFRGEIREFAINFVKEAKPGDTIALYGAAEDGRQIVAGYVGAGLCFECIFTFEKQQ